MTKFAIPALLIVHLNVIGSSWANIALLAVIVQVGVISVGDGFLTTVVCDAEFCVGVVRAGGLVVVCVCA